VLDQDQIRQILPHRGPALLLERVLELEPGVRALGTRRIHPDDPFLEGHFPGQPVVPGAAIIEMMAQLAGVLTLRTLPERMRAEGVALLGLDKTRFRRALFPGDEVTIEVTITQRRDPVWRFDAVVTVGDERVAEASLLAGLITRDERGLSVHRTGVGRKG